MQRLNLLLFAVAMLFICCTEESIPANKTGFTPPLSSALHHIGPSLAPALDTNILLSNITTSSYTGKLLTTELAREILYAHFTAKGYYTDEHFPADICDSLVASYDTIYMADLNGSTHMDAVITYWFAPYMSCGHCILPQRAIIADTDTGYCITNEKFIPDEFYIDSIVTRDAHVTIYGSDIECANGRVRRPIKVRIR